MSGSGAVEDDPGHSGGHRPAARQAAFWGISASLVLTIGCVGASPERVAAKASEITSGTEAAAAPEVVVLTAAGRVECTGTLIAPRVVLTAAHCLQVPLDQVGFGASPKAPVAVRKLVAARPHASYDAATRANDFALLLMEEPAPVAPITMAAPGLALSVGDTVRIVGFGQTGPTTADADRKREGVSVVSRVGASDFELHPGPSQPCFGDSGGPVFVDRDGKTVLAGVVSEGDKACAEYSRIGRVGEVVADFVAPFVAATAEGAASFGQRCYYPEQCASGVCAAPLEAPSIRSCTQVCGPDAACPAGSKCVPELDSVSHCRVDGPVLGGFGAACTMDTDCDKARCVRTEKAAVCSVACLPQFDDSCPKGFSCSLDPDRPSAWGCVPAPVAAADSPTPTESCALRAIPRSRGTGGTVVLVVASMLGLLRRRRS